MAQDFNAGKAVFRAVADFSNLRKEARAAARDMNDLDRATREVGSRSGGSHEAEGKKAGSGWARGFATALGAIGKPAAMLALAGVASTGVQALGGLTAGVFSLGSSILSLTGVAAAAPGVLAGMAAGGVALGLALKGAGDYLGDLKPGFDAIQKSTAWNFFYEANKPIHEMVNKVLPDLKDGIENIGTSWGKVAAAGANEMKRMLGNGQLKYMLEETRKGVLGLAPAMQPMIHGMVFLGMAGVKYLSPLSAWFVTLAQKFDAFATRITGDGTLDMWVKNGVKGFKDLWRIISDVIKIVAVFWKAGDANSDWSLGKLADSLDKILAKLKTPEFQRGLGLFFAAGTQALDRFMGLIGPVLGLVGSIATGLAGPLGSIFGDVERFISALEPYIGPLTTILGPALSSLFKALVDVAIALLPVLVPLAGAITAIVVPISSLISVLASVPGLLPVLAGMFVALGAAIAGIQVANFIAGIWGMVTAFIPAIASAWAFAAALLANPITWIVVGLALIVAGLIWFFTQTEVGRVIWATAWQFITDSVNQFVGWWTGVFWPLVMSIWNLFIAYAQMGFAVWGNIWNAIWTLVSNIFNAIVGIVSTGLQMVVALIQGRTADAMALFFSLGSQIQSFFANAGGWLADAGRNIIQGLIDGIGSMIGNVAGAMGNVMGAIANFLPHSPAKEGPFSGRGWTPYSGKALMGGFAEGIDSDGSAEAAAQAAMTKIAGAFDVGNLMKPQGAQLDQMAALNTPAVPPSAAAGTLAPPPVVSRTLDVTVNNPTPEPPSQSIQKTYSKIAYLGLDAEEPAA